MSQRAYYSKADICGTGKKLQVSYRSREQVEKKEQFLDYISDFVFKGMFDFEPTLNKALPDVTITRLEDFIKHYLA